MPSPVHLRRIGGVATAEAVRGLMPTFDLENTLRLSENRIVEAARGGKEIVDVNDLLPRHDGKVAPSFIADARDQVRAALRAAGYTTDYHGGGHHAGAELIVSWEASK